MCKALDEVMLPQERRARMQVDIVGYSPDERSALLACTKDVVSPVTKVMRWRWGQGAAELEQVFEIPACRDEVMLRPDTVVLVPGSKAGEERFLSGPDGPQYKEAQPREIRLHEPSKKAERPVPTGFGFGELGNAALSRLSGSPMYMPGTLGTTLAGVELEPVKLVGEVQMPQGVRAGRVAVSADGGLVTAGRHPSAAIRDTRARAWKSVLKAPALGRAADLALFDAPAFSPDGRYVMAKLATISRSLRSTSTSVLVWRAEGAKGG